MGVVQRLLAAEFLVPNRDLAVEIAKRAHRLERKPGRAGCAAQAEEWSGDMQVQGARRIVKGHDVLARAPGELGRSHEPAARAAAKSAT